MFVKQTSLNVLHFTVSYLISDSFIEKSKYLRCASSKKTICYVMALEGCTIVKFHLMVQENFCPCFINLHLKTCVHEKK